MDFQWLYRLAVEEVPEHDYMLPLLEVEACNLYLIIEEFQNIFLKKFAKKRLGDVRRQRHNSCWFGSSAICHGAGLH